MAKSLKIRDLTLRDGQQSSFATRMNPAPIDRCRPFYKDANFYAMVVWGGAVPDSVMRYLNENPWTRLETIHKAIGNVSKLTALSRGRNLFGYAPYTDEIIDGFCRNSIQSGLGIMRIFDAMNDIDNMKPAIKYTDRYGGMADCAVCYAIDRQAIVDSVLLGEGMPAYGPLQRNIYNDESVEHYDYNPDKARAILEDAGCTLGADGFYTRGGEQLAFTISVMSGEQDRIDIAQAAAQQIRAIGINCTVEIPAQMDWGGQMACLIGWGSPFDADDHTYKVFGTDKGANYSSYSNAAVDEALTKARQSDAPAVRKAYYADFQQALAADPAYAFICYIDANYVAKSNIKGIDTDTVLGHHGVGIFWNVQNWEIA